jgi:hypothetical protein
MNQPVYPFGAPGRRMYIFPAPISGDSRHDAGRAAESSVFLRRGFSMPENTDRKRKICR